MTGFNIMRIALQKKFIFLISTKDFPYSHLIGIFTLYYYYMQKQDDLLSLLLRNATQFDVQGVVQTANDTERLHPSNSVRYNED